MSGILYIVATPIGNMKDITYRSVEILQSVDIIACEDTRVTGRLCDHYSIPTKRIAVHHHTKPEKLQELVREIVRGMKVVYVSDAGTPGISDPGNQLVNAAIEKGVQVTPIPGPSAVTALLSIAGINTQTFIFMAYPPHKKGRKTFFEKICNATEPVVYYDSVHRIIKNLTLLGEMMPDANVIVGRELTKMFEEIKRGSPNEILQYFSENPSKVKGEFVVLVSH